MAKSDSKKTTKVTVKKVVTKKIVGQNTQKVAKTVIKTKENVISKDPSTSSKKTKAVYYESVGRRREATARVRLYMGKAVVFGEKTYKSGDFIVNGVSVEQFFPFFADINVVKRPLIIADALDRFIVSIRVAGGGKQGQIDAVSHGIARALCKVPDADMRGILKKAGLLKRDARTRERRRPGTGGKARRLKQSPKR